MNKNKNISFLPEICLYISGVSLDQYAKISETEEEALLRLLVDSECIDGKIQLDEEESLTVFKLNIDDFYLNSYRSSLINHFGKEYVLIYYNSNINKYYHSVFNSNADRMIEYSYYSEYHEVLEYKTEKR